ncbi:hypothetical protein EX30DRAFT_373923 [Ascodesmis nigricans]|uniref:Uncharacterized protein n=1 Tax=Ascodesmis nigricans TaxID=341454 RepID=A0A4S2MN31_9PEZI|nr:hypothetical protein EX30DRAFT_373923 [Ascodesmis nigricans]
MHPLTLDLLLLATLASAHPPWIWKETPYVDPVFVGEPACRSGYVHRGCEYLLSIPYLMRLGWNPKPGWKYLEPEWRELDLPSVAVKCSYELRTAHSPTNRLTVCCPLDSLHDQLTSFHYGCHPADPYARSPLQTAPIPIPPSLQSLTQNPLFRSDGNATEVERYRDVIKVAADRDRELTECFEEVVGECGRREEEERRRGGGKMEGTVHGFGYLTPEGAKVRTRVKKVVVD